MYIGKRGIMVASINLKGSLPLLILRILVDGENHGYQIAKQIKETSQGVLDFKEGTLYPTLHTLERQKLIQSEHRVQNGRKRRYYRLTAQGHKALLSQQAEWDRYTAAVNRVLEGGAS
jgi:transcriptional regulator